MKQKRLPPFGRDLLAARYRGLAPRDLFVCLDDWRAFPGRVRVVLPPDLNPFDADLTFAAGVDCIVAWDPSRTSTDRMHDTAAALAKNFARRIWVLNRVAPHQSFFVKSVRLGLELPQLLHVEEEDEVAA